ncbi:hexokinase family protein [Draconibacterium halophilum]|uniref:Hexokinase n=1 Tax=Draconibacterium halophilum TaxID=2706887 RepID=A0A6C0RK17_9BACT|nr:hexokinase [Draconibacterium halophilum]QIA09581.1 hexokinase [Draconibacterium halophilum]
MTKTTEFLRSHKMTAKDVNMKEVVNAFLDEMAKGLAAKESSLLMLPTYIEADGEVKANEPVVAIDAGGTNFRAAKVYFDDNLKLVTENIKKAKMPGVEKELTKTEFFDTFASYLADYKNTSDKLGFCFSYAAEIFPNKDGKLIEWSKEVKAPDVVGEMIGEGLLKAMQTPDKQLVLMNDTVSTLLAGKAARAVKAYDSYIGFILGTGTNTSYIEANKNITKTDGLNMEGSQIINIESGAFSLAPRTDIDIAFDNTTDNPGRYAFEKMFSGGYFGGLCTTALKTAAAEGVFSNPEVFDNLKELTSEEVNNYVHGIASARKVLPGVFTNDSDKMLAAGIIDGLIERAAKLVAANLAAVILQTGKGKTHEKPILMTIEGTTFYKLHNFRRMFEEYLQDFLSGDNQRFYEIVEVENSSLLGAAIAAIVN